MRILLFNKEKLPMIIRPTKDFDALKLSYYNNFVQTTEPMNFIVNNKLIR